MKGGLPGEKSPWEIMLDRMPKGPRPRFCQFCGSKLQPIDPMHPPMFDEYTGERLPPAVACKNPSCNQVVTWHQSTR